MTPHPDRIATLQQPEWIRADTTSAGHGEAPATAALSATDMLERRTDHGVVTVLFRRPQMEARHETR